MSNLDELFPLLIYHEPVVGLSYPIKQESTWIEDLLAAQRRKTLEQTIAWLEAPQWYTAQTLALRQWLREILREADE